MDGPYTDGSKQAVEASDQRGQGLKTPGRRTFRASRARGKSNHRAFLRGAPAEMLGKGAPRNLFGLYLSGNLVVFLKRDEHQRLRDENEGALSVVDRDDARHGYTAFRGSGFLE